MKVRKTMSQEYRMPEGGQESYGKRLWHLWSPLILKMAIGFGVSVLAAGAFSIIFMAKNPDLVNQATMDQSKISDLYQQLMGEILQVTTIVEGVAALVTIPVLLVMFHKDRLRERMAGIVPNKKAPLWKYFALILMVLGISLGFNNLVLIGNLSSYDAAYEQTISDNCFYFYASRAAQSGSRACDIAEFKRLYASPAITISADCETMTVEADGLHVELQCNDLLEAMLANAGCTREDITCRGDLEQIESELLEYRTDSILVLFDNISIEKNDEQGLHINNAAATAVLAR